MKGGIRQGSSTGKPPRSQKIHEYVKVMTMLPKLCPSDRAKLKLAIEDELDFNSFKDMTISELNLANKTSESTPILDSFSIRTGVSLQFLHPPVLKCQLCKGNLHVNNTWNFNGKPPTQVKVHTMNGTKIFSKVCTLLHQHLTRSKLNLIVPIKICI